MSTEGEGKGEGRALGSVKPKDLVRGKLETNAVQLEFTNSVIKRLGLIGILRLRLSGMVFRFSVVVVVVVVFF